MASDEETTLAIIEFVREIFEAMRDEQLVFYEGCAVVVAPVGAPPEYITVMVDGINDPNVLWRGAPSTLNVADEVVVWENPYSKRREILGGGGAAGVAGGAPWGQTVTVAVSGGDYTSVAAACAAVAAVPPAAATPWTILVMSGVFNEPAGFTVPTYATLIGRGESTVIDCGDTVWTCGAYASAMDIVVKSTCNTWGACYLQQNTVGVVLHNVKVIIDQDTALTNYCFCWAGTGNAEAFHCAAEAVDTGTETVGFWIGGTVNEVLLWDCIADDTTHLDNGLELDNSACFATTKFCEFGGADDDVVTGAASTWNHYACQYDEGNSTINGTDNLLPGDGGGAGVLEVQVFS